MRKKDVYKWIERESKKLPEEAYFVPHKMQVKNLEEMKETGGRYIGEHKVNHARRIKRIWDSTKDFNEINKYFLKFGLQLNINEQ